jgi:hypothetical protein
VIAVAIFEEQAPEPEQQIIIQEDRRPYDYTDDLESSGEVSSRGGMKSQKSGGGGRVAKKKDVAVREPAAEGRVAPTTSGGYGGDGGGARRPAPPPPEAPRRRIETEDADVYEEMPQPDPSPRTNRPGLGTEFGEQRYSAASFTRFVRAADRPIAVAELRYNNAAGLAALGINAEPLPDQGEIMTRETADPFPGDGNYAKPPR